MFPVLNIGPLAIQSSGLIFLLGVWLGLTWSEKKAVRHHINPDLIYTVLFLVVAVSLIAARLGYAVIHLESYKNYLLDVFSLNFHGMDWPSGVLAGVLTFLIYVQKKDVPVWSFLDSLIPFFLSLNIALAAASLATLSAVGSETTLPWGIQIYDSLRHPVQIYHLLVAIGLTILFWPNRHKVLGIERSQLLPGGEFALFLMAFSLGMMVVQTFRAEIPVLFLSINLYHGIGLVLLFTGISLSRKRIVFLDEGGSNG
jgi:phosphatidylglycerol:prolipoprotein diacylglycerol transferase